MTDDAKSDARRVTSPIVSQPRILDLFCGAGGAARGYQLAGFHVTGVDIADQPNYAGDDFIRADALAALADGVPGARPERFDAIHASPPCQRYSAAADIHDSSEAHPDLVPPVRMYLRSIARPHVIENVERSPLLNPVLLCGSMFGLGVRRHRLFESNVAMLVPTSRMAFALAAADACESSDAEKLREALRGLLARCPDCGGSGVIHREGWFDNALTEGHECETCSECDRCGPARRVLVALSESVSSPESQT